LSVDNLNFKIYSAITTVDDYLQITGGNLNIGTSGTNVTLSSGSNGVYVPPGVVAQTLTGLGAGGGSTYTFANKSETFLTEIAANAFVNLNSTAPGTAEFCVDGTPTTTVNIYSPQAIQTNVSVQGAATLWMYANNVSTPQNVTVTQNTISGTGLFGNNGVTVS
jgi:hypothetical protein